jgi:hypothetical protein
MLNVVDSIVLMNWIKSRIIQTMIPGLNKL